MKTMSHKIVVKFVFVQVMKEERVLLELSLEDQEIIKMMHHVKKTEKQASLQHHSLTDRQFDAFQPLQTDVLNLEKAK